MVAPLKIKAKIKYYLELLNLKIFAFIGQTELKSVFNRNLNLFHHGLHGFNGLFYVGGERDVAPMGLGGSMAGHLENKFSE